MQLNEFSMKPLKVNFETFFKYCLNKDNASNLSRYYYSFHNNKMGIPANKIKHTWKDHHTTLEQWYTLINEEVTCKLVTKSKERRDFDNDTYLMLFEGNGKYYGAAVANCNKRWYIGTWFEGTQNEIIGWLKNKGETQPEVPTATNVPGFPLSEGFSNNIIADKTKKVKTLTENITRLEFKSDIQVADSLDSFIYFLKHAKSDYRIILDLNANLYIISKVTEVHYNAFLYAVQEGWYGQYIQDNDEEYWDEYLEKGKIILLIFSKDSEEEYLGQDGFKYSFKYSFGNLFYRDNKLPDVLINEIGQPIETDEREDNIGLPWEKWSIDDVLKRIPKRETKLRDEISKKTIEDLKPYFLRTFHLYYMPHYEILKRKLGISESLTEAVNKLNEDFKTWFGNSKVTKDGKPLIVYHGSSEKFDTFEPDRMNYGSISKGFCFFTNKKSAYPNCAKDYAGKDGYIYECYLRIEKPLHVKYGNTPDEYYHTPIHYWDTCQSDIRREFRKGNYDGIIIENQNKNEDDSIIYLVPNANQIKSINAKEFSNSENIYEAGYNLNEKFEELDDEIWATKSAYDILNQFKNKKNPLRVVYDRNKNYYFIGNALRYIHGDLISAAYKMGFYYEDLDEPSRNEIMIYLGNNLETNDVLMLSFFPNGFGDINKLDNERSSDWYTHKYVYDFGLIYVHEANNFESFDLYNVLGNPKEKEELELPESFNKINTLFKSLHEDIISLDKFKFKKNVDEFTNDLLEIGKQVNPSNPYDWVADKFYDMSKWNKKDWEYLFKKELNFKDIRDAQTTFELMSKKVREIADAYAKTNESLNEQRAYHGSPYKFDKFDLSKFQRGDYGYGVYFTHSKGYATDYGDVKEYIIPDNEYLLDWDFNTQSETVEDALYRIWQDTKEKDTENKIENAIYGTYSNTGGCIYYAISEVLGLSTKETAEFLYKYGIKGTESFSGNCIAIFNPNDISLNIAKVNEDLKEIL